MADCERLRQMMVERQIIRRGVGDPRLWDAMRRVPRERFVAEDLQSFAYEDRPLPVEAGQTISQPYIGDGTVGWQEEAPFDAILVAAGGPGVPPPLREQLAIGGRLVMPVGDGSEQQLVRIIRKGEEDFDVKMLEPVRFVPLIGAHGWSDGTVASKP